MPVNPQAAFDPTVNDWLIRIGQLREAEKNVWSDGYVRIDTKKVAPAALAASLKAEAQHLMNRIEMMGKEINERWQNTRG